MKAVFAALYLAGAASAAAYAVLQSRNNSHATLFYMCLLHLTVLPLLAVWWSAAKAPDAGVARMPNLAWAAGVAFTLAALWLSVSIGHGRMISDESAYRFQAQIFACGRLKAAAMPGARPNPAQVPVEIYFEHTLQTPNGWYAKYPPGWPSILAAGYWLRCPWLLNPAFGILQLIVIWRVAKLWGRNAQILAVVMAATSAYMIFNSAGYMSHACEAWLSLAALSLMIRGVSAKRMRLIGGAFALAVIAIPVRPFTSAVVALLLTLIAVLELRGDRGALVRALALAAVAGACSIGAFLFVNFTFTGNALLSPYALSRGSTAIGELTLSPTRIITNIMSIWRWSMTGTLCFTFPFMLLFAAYGCWHETKHRRELLYLASLFPLLVAAYCFQKDGSGSLIGERYYYESFGPLTIAAACGCSLLFDRWRTSRQAALAGLALLIALQAVTLAFAWRQVAAVVHPYNEAYAVATSQPGRPLVFLSGNTDYFTSKHVNWNAVNWSSAPVIYLNDPGPLRRDAAACAFDRPNYRVVWWDPPSRRMEKSDADAVCP
jgi:hypothetical protein